MKTFLIVVAGMVVGLVVCALLAYLWLRHKLTGVGRALGAAMSMASLPVFRITLEPVDAAQWKDAAGANLISGHFAFAGYHTVGDFRIPELEGVILRGFFHPAAGSYAALYEHQERGIYADVVQDFADGTTLTVTSAPETGMDRPDYAPLVRLELDITNPAGAVQLHERLIAESDQREPMPATADEFAHVFVETYSQEMDWRIARGGISSEEVHRAALAGGIEAPDATAVEMVLAIWSQAIDAFVEEQVRDAWLASSAMSAAEWEAQRDRLVVVHERSDREEKIEELADAMVEGHVPEDDCDAEERALDAARGRLQPIFEASGMREAFARAQALLPEKRRYEKVASVEEPWAGDLYLLPSSPDPA